jgi:RNA polymerase sigma-70 factor (sigma-E family)
VFRDRLPRIEARYRQVPAEPLEQAFSSIALERCWQIIQDMPERQHAVALLRWQLDMKESEIAAVLGMTEKTVSVHLHRARHQLITQDGAATSSQEDMLLSRLYHQVTERQQSRFAAEYDLAAGLDRYQAWLSEWSADRAVTELYSLHYRSLVRLAALLVRDIPTAEEVVQDSFVAMHGGWQRLRDAEKALAYLRQAVVNRSRSVLRHRTVVDKNLQKAPPDMPSAEHGALTLLERSAVVTALRGLPDRQRQAIVLRYYADLSEAEIADAMQISRGAVKSHTARGMAALRAALEQE